MSSSQSFTLGPALLAIPLSLLLCLIASSGSAMCRKRPPAPISSIYKPARYLINPQKYSARIGGQGNRHFPVPNPVTLRFRTFRLHFTSMLNIDTLLTGMLSTDMIQTEIL
ncbi:hypothetical protein METBIDRAFT_82362 [Metschnikowia bicuspidata var. bicuspidata NRRL YB-4993]|uniref:Uncharacterized protein n=1 Tax=Metschnikowia bicuspidata var. bicuspidata NRRL YB-4993 TaxID=869754 RepID=A0A1A0HE68_9ASCO|nr:hypothetical protein METBIDRAFT_82362 [Metschnikowia bicuspidata var. bicuspidata NRRL YB-4993]OBA22404.1 hypothetical protein METBIDRAFT_82362 [Metschnikowia bicuspidata var. bicuspidata NRRL YB-4993]